MSGFRYFFYITIFLSLPLTHTLKAADSLRVRFGIHGHYGVANPSIRYYGTEGIPNCCPQFTEGTGNIYSIGALAEIPLTSSFLFAIRGSFLHSSIDLSKDENTIGLVSNAEGTITFNHSFIGNFSGIDISPLFGWRPTNGLNVWTGPGLTILTSPSFEQKETIKPGTRGTFLDGKRTRNSFVGNLNDASTLVWNWTVGIGYDLPLDKERSFFISPEVLYTLGLTDMVKPTGDSYWKNSYLRAGIALKYMPHKTIPPLPIIVPPPPPPPVIVKIPEPEPPKAELSLEIVQHDGTLQSDNIKIEEFVATQMFPLLNYVFFDEKSDQIPARYVRSTNETKNSFDEKSITSADAITLYYHILDLLGKRLIHIPSATVTLTGCLSGGKEEQGMPNLAQQRAENVAHYLENMWGISKDRISIETRAIPSSPGNTTKTEGLEENRRVEIRSSDKRITDPIIITDTVISGSAELRIYPTIQTPAGLKEWTITAKTDKGTIGNFSDKVLPKPPLKVILSEKDKTILTNSGTVSASLTVTDNKDRTVTATSTSIPFSVISLHSKRSISGTDKELDKYNLLLFGYDQSSLNEDHKRILSFVKSRIHNGAKITIKGSSDNLGDENYNADLSLQRAKETAKTLGFPAETLGVGTNGAGFDNTLPEGRFYNRTVEIQVENPIK